MRKGNSSITNPFHCQPRIFIRWRSWTNDRISTTIQRSNSTLKRSPYVPFFLQIYFLRWFFTCIFGIIGLSILVGCRTTDDYQDNPSYYAAPTAQTSPYAQVYTAQNTSPLYVPQPMTATNSSPTTTGVVNANGTTGATVAYACTPTAVMMTDGYGHYTTGYVQMCQPVTIQNGTVVPANTTASTVLPTTTASNTVYNPAQMPVQPLSGYPGYGTIQTPGGVAVIAIPEGTTSNGVATSGTTTTVGTAPPFGTNAYSNSAYGTSISTGEALAPPIPTGTVSTMTLPTNAATNTTETNSLQPVSPPPSFATISSELPSTADNTSLIVPNAVTPNNPNAAQPDGRPSTYANTASAASDVPSFQF